MNFTAKYINIVVITTSILLSLVLSEKDSISVTGSNCPPGYHFNDSINRDQVLVKCTEDGVLLRLGFCMTFDDDKNITIVGHCLYYQLDTTKQNVTEQKYIQLPSEVSDLNRYMCEPLNREGLICSKCMDGFAPSFTSNIRYQCVNCTNAWYGVPLFLIVELVPVTVLYLFMLVFQINLTSAPMTSFLLFSQLMVYTSIGLDASTRTTIELVSPTGYRTLLFLIALYSVFNLDFFRYILPPFCVSPRLCSSHLELLGYVTAYYPLFLILITYLIVKINTRKSNSYPCFKNKICQRFLQSEWICNIEKSLISFFASFLLLSSTKFMFTSAAFLGYESILSTDGKMLGRGVDVDPTLRYLSSEHLPYLFFGLFSLILSVFQFDFNLIYIPAPPPPVGVQLWVQVLLDPVGLVPMPDHSRSIAEKVIHRREHILIKS